MRCPAFPPSSCDCCGHLCLLLVLRSEAHVRLEQSEQEETVCRLHNLRPFVVSGFSPDMVLLHVVVLLLSQIFLD